MPRSNSSSVVCINNHLWSENQKFRIDPRTGKQVRFCLACRKDSDRRRAERKRKGVSFIRETCFYGHPKPIDSVGINGGTGDCLWCKHDNKLLSKYGLPKGTYLKLLTKQDGRCRICETDSPAPDKFFHLDHNHVTHEVRGLLCPTCNRGLGSFYDDKGKLLAAIDYLSKTKYEGIYIDVNRLRKHYPNRF